LAAVAGGIKMAARQATAVFPNGMLPHEVAQATGFVHDMGGGTFNGAPKLTPGELLNGRPVTSPDYPVLDGWYRYSGTKDTPVSLKQLSSENPMAILQDVRKANDVGRLYGITDAAMVVDAPKMSADRLTKFAEGGPLTGKALEQGVIDTVVVKTADGYVTVSKGAVVPGLPKGW
jgi:hypothetical protein